MILRWFSSRSVRHATAMRRHVWKLLQHQRDLLAPKAIGEIEAAIQAVKNAVAAKADKPSLEKQMEALEETANKWLKPYPNAAWRENVEVLLVALAVAMGIRTFFLQPFKIPTGSMQPTLFGVRHDNAIDRPDFKVPGWPQRMRDWFRGTNYLHVVANNDGQLEDITRPVPPVIFHIYQKIKIGGKWQTVWFPPDYGSATLQERAGLMRGQIFRKGQDVAKLMVYTGDHLFVDRVTYNFRPPTRGEIIVFETKGIPEEQRMRQPSPIPADQFYIKRLVALGGERVQPGDRKLIINGRTLDASTPHFENIYSFDPDDSPRDSEYSGHVFTYGMQDLAPFFKDKPDGYTLPRDHLMVLGDNTVSSLDSRFWGSFPAHSVIGKAFFVYWPVSDRFGWGFR